MSTPSPTHNLIELMRRREQGEGPAVALSVLKQAVEARGELTDDDRRLAAARSGLPEATVYGISTFYDDFVRPRGRRHVQVCTGTACWASRFGAQVGELEAALGVPLNERSADGETSLSEVVCLGFCHSGPSYRDGDVVDAGPGAGERVGAGDPREAAEPEWRSALDEPVLTAPGTYAGLRRALDELGPERLLDEVEAAEVKGRGGAGFPAGTKWRFARRAEGSEKVIVVNGDEGDPGSYIDKLLMERNPALLLEGMALAGLAVGAERGYVYVRSEYPGAKAALEDAFAAAVAAGELGDEIRGSGFSFHVAVVEGAGSYVVGEETALLNSLMGMRGTVSARPPFPAERGYDERPTVVNNVETLCNVPFVAANGADAYRALSPDATPGTKLVSLNERFRDPAVIEVPFGVTVREICERHGGGLVDGGEIKAIQIGGPLGGILPAAALDTRFDFDDLAAQGCMVGHGGIVAFDQRTDMRELGRHLMHFGATESCGKCFPCRIGLQRGLEIFDARVPVDRDSLEQLLETLEVASLCAHGGGLPAPIRSLIAHWPAELGMAAAA